ncbi:MAG: tetratricopeptide repeat protein [Bacteroidota bacterium]|nr:tetratricopeptide repeat protein [Bacteroidota bacterium]
MRFNKAQIIIIAVLLGMVVILVYLNFKTPESTIAQAVAPSGERLQKQFDFNEYLSGLKDSLSSEANQRIQEQTQLAKAPDAGVFTLLNLANTWDSLHFRMVSAFYLTQLAARVNDENSWFNAGLKYYEFAATCQDTSMQVYAANQAIFAFEKVVMLNENNLEAKNALANCYIQTSSDIMKAVQLLKDVTNRDSFNVEAHYTLGMLSMRSGQWDKAITRFEKCVAIQPFNAEYHYFLGEAYSQSGKKNEAIREFETFRGLVPDEEVKKNIDITINKLKNTK